jgi:hypothetical protein
VYNSFLNESCNKAREKKNYFKKGERYRERNERKNFHIANFNYLIRVMQPKYLYLFLFQRRKMNFDHIEYRETPKRERESNTRIPCVVVEYFV